MRYATISGVVLALSTAGAVQAAPVSDLYLTYTEIAGYVGIGIVHGNSTSSIPAAYTTGGLEIPIAVDGDIRTTNYLGGGLGGQYSLSGTATGVSYKNPGFEAYDGTTDGRFNYVVDYGNGNVIRTDRDYQNPVFLFNVGAGNIGITYDPTNDSLWIAGWYSNQRVTNYSMLGAMLSSFDTGHTGNGALALDHADNTLWLVDDSSSLALQQFSKNGDLLSSGPRVGYTLGGEFDLRSANAVPEPSDLLLVSSAMLATAWIRRRRSVGPAARA